LMFRLMMTLSTLTIYHSTIWQTGSADHAP
jgi:hypothetical protein